MNFLVRTLFLVGLLVLIDLYAYQAFKTLAQDQSWKGWVKWVYWGIHIAFYLGTITFMGMMTAGVKLPHIAFHYLVTPMAILYVPKLPIVILLLGEDIFRAGTWGFHKISWLFNPPEAPEASAGISRAKFLSLAATGLATIPFAALIWGTLRGKYDFKVFRHTLAFKDLPEELEGLTITQISDLHCGSFEDREAVAEGIKLANDQNSDLIFFTGDLVNMTADEVDEWEDIFGSLSAPMGVYSVLGNHDYGDYVRDFSDAQRRENLQRLVDTQKRMGWDLLLNENRVLDVKGKKLAVVGVENTSARNFKSRGDLAGALRGTDQADLKLLLSHDPSHWDSEIRKFPDVSATFSGHTHGFQMGIEIPGFKWSPVQYVYKQWAGLYEQAGQYLYVNRGFGFHAYRGRVGIKPEISVFELRRA